MLAIVRLLDGPIFGSRRSGCRQKHSSGERRLLLLSKLHHLFLLFDLVLQILEFLKKVHALECVFSNGAQFLHLRQTDAKTGLPLIVRRDQLIEHLVHDGDVAWRCAHPCGRNDGKRWLFVGS